MRGPWVPTPTGRSRPRPSPRRRAPRNRRPRRTSIALTPAEIAELARTGGRLAVDTEFVSERRYRALLCLIQVAVPDPDRPGSSLTEVLDPLVPFDGTPIAAVLADPRVEIVFHAGRQDVALLRRVLGTEVRSIFDTQVAAGFVGLPAGAGYADLVQRVLDVSVRRSEALTRWDERPLGTDQLAYAREDVTHVLALAAAIRERLEAAGRLEWALEECRALEEVSDERDVDRLFERLPRVGRLTPPERGLAREIVAWRERESEELDRPASRLLPDASVVELAKRRPRDRRGLEAIRGLPEATVHRRHRSLLEAIAQGADAPPIPRPPSGPDHDRRDGPVVSLAQALARHRAQEEGLAAELLASQGELAAVVSAVRRGDPEPTVRPLEGWRREVLGDELLELLRGRRSLLVAEGGRLRVEEATGGE